VAAEAKDCLRSCCKGGLVVAAEAKDCLGNCYLLACGGSRG
jgi:hypothetical protein